MTTELLGPATATLAGLPDDYQCLLAIYPWVKVQPHEWEGKSAAERLSLVVESARQTVDDEEARLMTIQQELRAKEAEVALIRPTPVFRLVPGNIPGTTDIMYEDDVAMADRTIRQPFRIVNPKTLSQGRAILAQMAAYDALVKERDELAAQVEQLTKPKKK